MQKLEEIKKKNLNKNQGSNSETVSSISLKNKPELLMQVIKD